MSDIAAAGWSTGGAPAVSLARGLARDAAVNFARIVLLLGTIVMLMLVRSSLPSWEYPLIVAAALAAMYLVFGKRKGFLIWAGYVFAFVLFAHLRSLAGEGLIPAQFGYVIALEEGAFGGTAPTVWLQEHLYSAGRTGLLEVLTILVYISYFAAPHVMALAVWRLDPDRFKPYVAAVLLMFYSGLALAFLVPTAPPWMAGLEGHLPHVSRIFRELTMIGYEEGYRLAGPNDVAAMPSIHMGITVIVAMMAWRLRPIAGAAGWLYAAAMAFSLVYLGEHYVMDLAAGSLFAVVSWRVAFALAGGERREPTRASGDEAPEPVPAASPRGTPALSD
jgi:membrane-associated phospholipid phosphatase